jgi:hypothetical protein
MIEKGATVWHQLTWSHYKLLITLSTSFKWINIIKNVSFDEDTFFVCLLEGEVLEKKCNILYTLYIMFLVLKELLVWRKQR